MLPPGLQTPREVTLYYDALYDDLISTGKAVAFVYPWAGIGAFTVLGYLLIDHRRSPILAWLRFAIFAFLVVFQAWTIMMYRAKHPAGAFGVGLLSAWGAAWVATIMVFSDCQMDFQRIERREDTKTSNVTQKTTMNGHASDRASPSSSNPSTTGPFYWQSYPDEFFDRLDWVSDAFCSFRGVGWNWQSTGIPPLPKQIQVHLDGKTDDISHSEQVITSKTGIRRFTNKDLLLKDTFTHLIIGYLLLDLLKTLMHHDAYFWGYMDASAPTYLPTFIQNSHTVLKSYRLLISLAAIYTALWEIFKLGPAFFVGMLGPKCVGLRGEAFMNPADMFGSFSSVLNHGLAGWWGGWWHQTFRVAFEAPTTRLLEILKIEKKSQTGKMISLSVAFFVSGCLHACGSYTQLGDTRPIMGPMRFFLLQPFGIVLQMMTSEMLRKAGVAQKMPKVVRQTGNFVFVHVWMYFTAPLLVDDFAKGGVWLFEPVAISPLRALDLGAKDDGWFCWWDGLIFWRRGNGWWDTGIAL